MVVVFHPLFQFYASILVLVSKTFDIVSFESVQEFAKDVVLCALTANHIWMLLSIVDALDITQVNGAVQLCIEFIKSLLHNLLSICTHFTDSGANELVVFNLAVVVSIKNFENSLDFTILRANMVVIHGSLDFFVVQASVSILIHDSE